MRVYDQSPELLQAVLRAVALMKEAISLLDSVQCNSAGAALLDHAIHTLEADYDLSGPSGENTKPS